MPHLPRVSAFPIAGETSILTAAGAALKVAAREKSSALIGHVAPEFCAQDHLGRTVSLHATIQLGRPIVLYFFPLAGSPHCTKESCSFRDAVGTSPVFNQLDAVVIGISQDAPARSKRFVDEHQLGFRIVHDSNRHIMDAWGVGRGLLGLVDARCTFIIDHRGIVRAMLDGIWDYKGHRDFAERWLCRIEHDLAGRQRFYVPHDAHSVACDELSRNVKIIYGDALPARGIGTAPRHGAALAAIQANRSSIWRKSASSQLGSTSLSLSLAAEANRFGSLHPAKSRRNLKNWLRSSDINAAYDQRLHLDYQLSRSSDQVDQHAHATLTDRAWHRLARRRRSFRFHRDAATNVVARGTGAATRSVSLSRQASASRPGSLTPRTVSTASESTRETCDTGAARDSHALSVTTTIKNGTITDAVELECKAMLRQRAAQVTRNASGISGVSGAVGKTIATKRRSNSLVVNRTTSVAHNGADAVPDAAKANSSDGHVSAATVYANGNIARMPLRRSVNGDTHDGVSLTKRVDARTRSAHVCNDASHDSAYSLNSSSLPVPPRPSTRNGGVTIAPRASSLASRSTSSCSITSDGDHVHTPSSGAHAVQHQAAIEASRDDTRNRPAARPSTLSSAQSCGACIACRMQPITRSSSLATTRSLELTNAVVVGISAVESDHTSTTHQTRSSSTPSLATSLVSTCSTDQDGYMLHHDRAYSPSLAGSEHTFGGWQE